MKNIMIPEIAREIRRLKGCSLESASEKIDVCSRTLARAERGEGPFLVNYLPPLAKCYGITPADFFYYNPKTKSFDRPIADHYAKQLQEVETLKMQVRQLTEYIHLLQKVRAPMP